MVATSRRLRWPVSAVVSAILILAPAFFAEAAAEGYSLAYEFAPAQIPSPGSAATTPGSVGGLPSALSLTATKGACASGSECGTFAVSVAGIPASANAQFGQFQGTFACANSGCSLAITRATGIFAKVQAGAALSLHATSPSMGTIGTSLFSRGDWVATVARTAAAMKAGGELPAAITVKDLVVLAASNGAS